MPTVLIDTNVLLYAYDTADAERSARALRVLSHLQETQEGRLSVQCLAEFFSVATRKLKPPLEPAQALEQVELWANTFPVFELTVAIVREAARGVRDHQLAYYDAQVWATAKLNQIPLVLTKDTPSAGSLEGVRYVNPFAKDFVLEEWV